MLAKIWGKGNTYLLLARLQTGPATLELREKKSHNDKNKSYHITQLYRSLASAQRTCHPTL